MGAAIGLLAPLLALGGGVGATHTGLECPASVIVAQYDVYLYRVATIGADTGSGSAGSRCTLCINVTLLDHAAGAVEVGQPADTAQTGVISITYTATDLRPEFLGLTDTCHVTVFVSNVPMNCPACNCPPNVEADYQQAIIVAAVLIVVETGEWLAEYRCPVPGWLGATSAHCALPEGCAPHGQAPQTCKQCTCVS
jgi:hypothetical protein